MSQLPCCLGLPCTVPTDSAGRYSIRSCNGGSRRIKTRVRYEGEGHARRLQLKACVSSTFNACHVGRFEGSPEIAKDMLQGVSTSRQQSEVGECPREMCGGHLCTALKTDTNASRPSYRYTREKQRARSTLVNTLLSTYRFSPTGAICITEFNIPQQFS